jgi:predicted O-linked N-acetylglucosamine transferase (SPINDLY family)
VSTLDHTIDLHASQCVEAGRYLDAINALAPLGKPSGGRRRRILSQAWARLGQQAAAEHRYRAAIEAYENSLAIEPDQPAVQTNLGSAYSLAGDPEHSLRCLRRALEFRPDFGAAASNLLLALQYTSSGAGGIAAEHKARGSRIEQSAIPFHHWNNPRNPERPLRIGYVSGDFRRHPVASFFEPLLEAHSSSFSITCYSNSARTDRVTARLQSLASRWRTIAGIPDADVAAQVMEDGIDILVDLSGHTHGHRLGLFARRPAPVQVTYLGYPDTTGLEPIHYRLSDAIADPPGWTESFHSETLVRLPAPFLCYRPPVRAPRASRLPVSRTGEFTFGCFNSVCKLSDQTLEVWARLLEAVPRSRLLLKCRSFKEAATRDHFRSRLSRAGIARRRVELRGYQPDEREHLATYHDVDLALDPFPYNGTATTCESLWMGVPVVTLAGSRHASRVGASLLQAAGLAEFVATDPSAYIDIAVRTATDPARLAALRRALRPRIAASPLCDAAAHARKVEAAYRTMWRAWVLNQESSVATGCNSSCRSSSL